jgi:hypothetical protein
MIECDRPKASSSAMLIASAGANAVEVGMSIDFGTTRLPVNPHCQAYTARKSPWQATPYAKKSQRFMVKIADFLVRSGAFRAVSE